MPNRYAPHVARRGIEERNELVENNMGLIGYAFKVRGLKNWNRSDWDDIKQEMTLKLIRGADLWDSSIGTLSNYCFRRLCQAAGRWIENRKRKDHPTIDHDVIRCGRIESYRNTIPDPATDKKIERANNLLEGLEAGLKILDPRTQRIFRSRYWHDDTFSTIASREGVTKQRIHQIHDRGMEKLRVWFDENNG